MLIKELFSRDSCTVCGQTPCNCTHLAESTGTELPPAVIEMIKKIAQSSAKPEHKKAAIDALVAKYSKQGVAEGNETTPFGSVNDQRPQIPAVPQQDREAQDQAQERQARINNFREKKQDLLQQFAQLGTLRTEMIHGLDNNVFLNKEQLIDFFKQQIDDPSLTALEYAYENDIPTDGLIKNILRRATQLGISMLDVRKLFASAKQKVSENSNRKVDAKGLTQGEWMQRVKQKFPDAKIIQAKMIDGPAHALLSDGRKIIWNPVQGVAEVGQNFRRGNARRAALNAMSPEELRAHEEKRAEQQRKRDEARLERERQRNAAKKGVAEGSGDGYYYLQGGIERSKKFASEAEAMAHSKRFFQLARVSRVTLKYKEPGQPAVVVKEFTFKDTPPPKSQMSWGDFYLQGKKQGVAEGSLNEFTPGNSGDDDDYDDNDDRSMEATFTIFSKGKAHTGTVIIFPGVTTDVEYHLNGKIYIKNDMDNVYDYDDFITDAANYIQEIIQLEGDGHHFVEPQGVAEGLTYAQKHSSWSVQSPKKNEFNTPYKLDQEKEARAHAERIGGKLVKVDQHGHAIRAKKDVAEGEPGNLEHELEKRDYQRRAQRDQEAEYGPEYQDMVSRVKKLAGLGPMKTVYDPAKRVYRNIPTAQQPKK